MRLPWNIPEVEQAEPDILITGASIRGTSHKKEGTPCQDAWASFPIHGGGWVITAADGLSSASQAEKGAKDAVNISGEWLASTISRQPGIPNRKERIREAFRIARDTVLSRAREEDNNPASYASTLIILVYEHGMVTTGHIGDGMIVGIREGNTLIISQPEPGEYANETYCLVQEDWQDHLRIADYVDIEACIIVTDGCQGAIATRSDGEYVPHDPFILPLVSFIRQRMEAGIDPRADIAALLISSRMELLSGDDKTLIVLTGGNPA